MQLWCGIVLIIKSCFMVVLERIIITLVIFGHIRQARDPGRLFHVLVVLPDFVPQMQSGAEAKCLYWVGLIPLVFSPISGHIHPPLARASGRNCPIHLWASVNFKQ